MTRLYIAGPMTGIEDYNYPAFNHAAVRLHSRGFLTLNPVDLERENPTPGTPQHWSWYMRGAISMLVRADGVALLPGWEGSKGAQLEVEIATKLGMPVHPLDEWLSGEVAA